MTRKPERWNSGLGAILAVAGSAVGLGNFLRFPGQVVENGGGVFMIPYFLAFFLLGVPLCWAEWTMGRYAGSKGVHSCPAVFAVVSRQKKWQYVGVIGLVIPVIIYMYYVIVQSWCLYYAIRFLTGNVSFSGTTAEQSAQSTDFFLSLVGASADGALFNLEHFFPLVLFISVFTLNFLLIFKGVSKGIEKLCVIALPCMALSAFLILLRILTLDSVLPTDHPRSVVEGLGHMWEPKGDPWWERLLDADLWLAATGQVLFSLSVGFGVIINYASYLEKKSDVFISSLTAASTNQFFEVVFGGLITVTAAFVFLGSAHLASGTFSLGFITLPVVFEYMPLGRFFGFLWFSILFLAALTSSISMLQPAIAFLEEYLDIKRKVSVPVLAVLTLAGSTFTLYYSKDLLALDTMDFWVGTALIFILAMFQVFLFSYVLGAKKGFVMLTRGSSVNVPRLFIPLLRYVAPAYLLFIFLIWCIKSLPAYLDTLMRGGTPLLTVSVIIFVVIFFLALMLKGMKKIHRRASGGATL